MTGRGVRGRAEGRGRGDGKRLRSHVEDLHPCKKNKKSIYVFDIFEIKRFLFLDIFYATH